ncbi:uncharacterized protein LOC586122 [Strongylocentrotus purpuratus]|uniref:Methyltransferase domain-containing protein n=1 Tax=Strongylocentrotus purpuratus TaxID=7668 RepID=A0A7M7PFX9_STRPU|nr:uncharacterized protein LOC586122 [Strongylocentrotus purpuratus]
MAKFGEEETAGQFSNRLSGIVEGGLTSLSIAFGVKTGLFDILVEHHHTPMTSQELADAGGFKERYVREWLGAVAGARIVHLDPVTERYHIPAQLLDVFKKGTPQNHLVLATKAVPFLSEVFNDMREVVKKEGPLGLPFSKAKSFTEFEDDFSRLWYENEFRQEFIPSIPSLHTKLDKGISMLDVGCGHGAGILNLAEHYPRSRFVGIEIGEDSVKSARDLANVKNLTNVEFHCIDATTLPKDWANTFDYVFFHNVIHDLARPDLVLKEVKEVMKPEALMSVLEINASSKQANNIDSQGGSELYTFSLFHCLPVSCNTPGSLGLGTAWGKEAATEFFKEQGFTIKSITELPKLHFLCTVSTESLKGQ